MNGSVKPNNIFNPISILYFVYVCCILRLFTVCIIIFLGMIQGLLKKFIATEKIMNSKKKHFNIFIFFFINCMYNDFLKQRIMSLAENLKSQRTQKKPHHIATIR